MFSCHVTHSLSANFFRVMLHIVCQQIFIPPSQNKHSVLKKNSVDYIKVVAYKSFGKVLEEASL